MLALQSLGISVASAEHWSAYARTWLFADLQSDDIYKNSSAK
jgi:hypothetical protein